MYKDIQLVKNIVFQNAGRKCSEFGTLGNSDLVSRADRANLLQKNVLVS